MYVYVYIYICIYTYIYIYIYYVYYLQDLPYGTTASQPKSFLPGYVNISLLRSHSSSLRSSSVNLYQEIRYTCYIVPDEDSGPSD